MLRKIISSIALVFLSILVCIILLEIFQVIATVTFSIEEFLYTLVLTEVGYFLPLLLYFYSFNQIRKFLAKKNPDVFKMQNQYIIGIVLMIVALLFLFMVVIVSRGLSLAEIAIYLRSYAIVVAFAPIIISLEYIYEKKFSNDRF